MKYNRLLLGMIALLISALSLMAQVVETPRVVTPTSFAIVIDSKSYANAKAAVDAYRDVVEQDDLGTYLLIHDWSSPDEIRALLQQLHQDPSSPLEGCVLIGDIPVAMIRDAHHLTSAFKMDPNRYPWERSSVPSDRFYDCFSLKFVPLPYDGAKSHLFFYSLSSEGAQRIEADIYSARIRPYDRENETKYQALTKYLQKVVKERTNHPQNKLDHLTMARGHGYNSESKQAWAGEQIALREQLEGAFLPTGRFKAIDFDDKFPAKYYYLTEVQQPDLDVMLFHHHGAPQNQYINGYREGSTVDISKENIMLFARARARRLRKGETPEEAIQRVAKELDIPISWISDTFTSEMEVADSLFNRSLDIYIDDLRAIAPAARFVMLDACYNGSFHLDENISAEYIFNEGTTLAVQANSVNVIQDKWPDELLGLLADGMRLGSWHQQVMYLETHLIGDPTFRFVSDSQLVPSNLSQQVVLRARDANYWLQQLRVPSGDLQALALKMLYRMDYPQVSDLLLNAYRTSNSLIVRTEALKLLSQINDANFVEVLKEGVHDSYELIRRMSVELLGKNGSDALAPALVESLLQDSHCKRIVFKQSGALKMMDGNRLSQELRSIVASSPIYPTSQVEKLLSDMQAAESARERLLQELLPQSKDDKSIKDQLFAIRSCRNSPDARVAEALIKIAIDASNSESVRVASIEALGWYNYSCKASEIKEQLSTLLGDSSQLVSHEAAKSIKRLSPR